MPCFDDAPLYTLYPAGMYCSARFVGEARCGGKMSIQGGLCHCQGFWGVHLVVVAIQAGRLAGRLVACIRYYHLVIGDARLSFLSSVTQ